jgi:uncharacterized YigZ family protein
MTDAYTTISGPATAKITRNRSRFVAIVEPISSAEDVKNRLAEIRRAYHDATHHCRAYRLAADPAPIEIDDDDGEPSGAAGLPILQQLRGAELLDVLAVVVRYFGGVKLGMGGLVRAYGDATAAALARAPRLERWIEISVRLRFPSEATSAVMSVIHQHQAKVLDISYDTEGHVVVDLPPSRVDRFVESVREKTGARADVEVIP